MLQMSFDDAVVKGVDEGNRRMDTFDVAIWATANPIVGFWDADSVDVGIGGSEEAVIYASTQLARRNCTVVIYGNPPNGSRWSHFKSNPRYANESSFRSRDSDELNPLLYDIVICWRREDFEVARTRLKDSPQSRVFFWPHDLPMPAHTRATTATAATAANNNNLISLSSTSTTKAAVQPLDGVFYLSNYQKNLYEARSPEWKFLPNVISGNGIRGFQNKTDEDIELTDDQLKNKMPTSCIYLSNWARGLDLLIHIWPEVRRAVPQATLDVYYGPQTWGLWSAAHTNQLIEKMKTIEGVNIHGMVGHRQLDAALQRASIMAYPCNCFAETYCISGVKAQWRGVIPVTCALGALKETLCPGSPCTTDMKTMKDLHAYRDLLISTLNRVSKSAQTSPELLVEERRKYIQFAAPNTWSRCVDLWKQLMFTTTNKPTKVN